MKCRKGFVTNSSSSSFIIGMADDDSVTKDVVFELIRDLYRDYFKNRDNAIQFLKENHIKCYYNKEKGSFNIEYNMDKFQEINNIIINSFDISLLDRFDYDIGWLSCNSYQEYEEYWIEKAKEGKEEGKYYPAPFNIFDYIKDDFIKESTSEHSIKIDKTEHSWILRYYYPASDYFYDESLSCENCCKKEWCKDEIKKNCEQARERIKKENIQPNKLCEVLLGKICVLSVSGRMPFAIEEQLGELSNFFSYCM